MTITFVNDREVPVAQGKGSHLLVHSGSQGVPVRAASGDYWIDLAAPQGGLDDSSLPTAAERIQRIQTPDGSLGIKIQRRTTK